MPYSNISASVSTADRDAILVKLNEVKTLLPFLISLTKDERSTMLKMGDKSIAFVEKSLGHAQANTNLVPPYLDVAELNKDMALVKTITPIYNMLEQLYTSLDDTYMALGSEAFNASLTFYNTVRDASKRNVPGAKSIYEDLRSRFPGRPPKEEPIKTKA
jgi:hypothetical protein